MLGLNVKFTPEAFFMIPLALGLDLVGVVLICFGLDDFGITDMVGIGFINGWLILRGKKTIHDQSKKGTIGQIKNIFTGKTSKFIVPMFGELIPYLGALPFWTLSVLFNLSDE